MSTFIASAFPSAWTADQERRCIEYSVGPEWEMLSEDEVYDILAETETVNASPTGCPAGMRVELRRMIIDIDDDSHGCVFALGTRRED